MLNYIKQGGKFIKSQILNSFFSIKKKLQKHHFDLSLLLALITDKKSIGGTCFRDNIKNSK